MTEISPVRGIPALVMLAVLSASCAPSELAPSPPAPTTDPGAEAPPAPADETRDTVPAGYHPGDVPEPEPAALDLAGTACQSIARFLNIRSAVGAQLSPDGRTLIYRTSTTGLQQLWRVAPDAAGVAAYPEQLTFGNRVQFAAYSPAGDWIAYGTDWAGDERTQFLLLSPDGTRERELTPADGAFRNWGGWSPRGDRVAYSSTERDGRNFDIWYPELYTAGVNIVGVANWITGLEDASPELKNSDLIEYGDIDDPDDRDFFRSISPIQFADRITGHLMVIHGANDPRVPVAEADQIVTAVRAAGGDVTYLRFPDEGHGIARLENRITAYQGVARFLDGSIGGSDMPCWER